MHTRNQLTPNSSRYCWAVDWKICDAKKISTTNERNVSPIILSGGVYSSHTMANTVYRYTHMSVVVSKQRLQYLLIRACPIQYDSTKNRATNSSQHHGKTDLSSFFDIILKFEYRRSMQITWTADILIHERHSKTIASYLMKLRNPDFNNAILLGLGSNRWRAVCEATA